MPKAVHVPAAGEVEYQYIVVPTGFTEDKWISQVEIRPSDRTVVHHAVIFIREPGNRWLPDAKPGGKVLRCDVNKISASAICYFSPGTLL